MRSWSTVAWLMMLGGFGLMCLSQWRQERVEQPVPWTEGVMCVAEDPALEEPDQLGGRRAIAHFLPVDPGAESVAQVLAAASPELRRSFSRSHQETVILFPDFDDAFTQEMLASGRLPLPGSREVLAGHLATQKDQITVADQAFDIVGVFGRHQWPLASAYLLPDHPAHSGLFEIGQKSVNQVRIFTEAEWKEIGPQAAELLPKDQYTRVAGVLRAERGPYYAYLAGMLFLLCGGSSLLVKGYVVWSQKATGRWVGPALAAIRRRWRLFCSLHLVYFGMCLGGMLAIYELPNLQDALMTVIQGQVQGGSGVLGIAGQAYLSQNIALAAVATLLINLLVGSLLVITLPSVVVPGIGILVAVWRALLWGILLAPTHVAISRAMLPHSWTLLLEGEAYILASFFALLIPIYLFDRSEGATVGSRYGRAILMNLRGNLLVLLVLTVAAIYEAIEVILQM